MAAQKKERAGALSDLRVVDMATLVAGPSSARYLSDFGADVIKVERPGGDDLRRMSWLDPEDGNSYFWKLHSRNKRSITLDLRADDDHATMAKLLRRVDVLVENMRPGKLEAMGFAPEKLWQENPGLVILRTTGFGQHGPYASRAGFATLAEAMSGFASILGEADGPPLLPPTALTDEIAGLIGAFSVMVALRARDQTGRGQVIDVSLLESMLQLMGPLPAVRKHLGYEQPRLGSGIPYSVPRGNYRTKDGGYVAISASAQSIATRINELLGVADDPRFANHHARVENREAIDKLLGDWIAARPLDEVVETLVSIEAAVAPVYQMGDVLEDPHVKARNAIIEVDGITMQGLVAKLSETPGEIRFVGGALGADTEEILAELNEQD